VKELTILNKKDKPMGRGPFHREYPWGGRIPIDAKATGKNS